MRTLALLLAYESDGSLRPSGPGDTLRLAHALTHPTFADKQVLIATTEAGRGLIDGLFPDAAVLAIGAGGPPAPKVPPVALDGLAAAVSFALGGDVDSVESVVHPFIGDERERPGTEVAWELAGRRVYRRRIDSSTIMSYRRWTAPLGRPCAEPVLAAFLRLVNRHPERNSPAWFPEIVRGVARHSGYRLLWCGDEPNFELLQGEARWRGRLAFGEQMVDLRREAQQAVGWNSGGLDLAAAGGVPVLRVGEFQIDAADVQRLGLPKDWAWGKAYNWYLACSTNVGLAPVTGVAHDVDRDVLAESLTAFLAVGEQLLEPRHVILPRGVALAGGEVGRWQLANYEVRVAN